MQEQGDKVDYKKLANLTEFKEQFLKQLNLLAYTNIQHLVENNTRRKSFFVNLYNILNIHATIDFIEENGHMNIKRTSFYDTYSYNIGGINYTLNDIEHGVLRLNDNICTSKLKVYWKLCLGQSLTDKSSPRFQKENPKNKLAQFTKLDPRIHFALNCGAKSCPPIRVYEHEKIEKQLDVATKAFVQNSINTSLDNTKNIVNMKCSKLFSWYQSDFGETQIELLKFIQQYSESELKRAIDLIFNEKWKYKISYDNYDWTVNNHDI